MSRQSRILEAFQELVRPNGALRQAVFGVVRDDLASGRSVFHLDFYFPTRFEEARRHEPSRMMLNFKAGESDGVNYFLGRMGAMFGEALDGGAIIAVPGHKAGPADPSGGLRSMLARMPAVDDLSDCMIRTKDVTRTATASASERPSVIEHVDSLRIVNPERLRGRHIVLLDDVLTCGHSMWAACSVAQIGSRPASLHCLALLRTVHGSAAAVKADADDPGDYSCPLGGLMDAEDGLAVHSQGCEEVTRQGHRCLVRMTDALRDALWGAEGFEGGFTWTIEGVDMDPDWEVVSWRVAFKTNLPDSLSRLDSACAYRVRQVVHDAVGMQGRVDVSVDLINSQVIVGHSVLQS